MSTNAVSTKVDHGDGGGVEDRPDAAAFRRAMGLVPTGIAVIAVGNGPRTEAMTASSVTSISLDPLLVLVSVGTTGRLRTAIEGAGGFAVSILAQDQAELSGRFAARDRPSGLVAQELLGSVVGRSGHLVVPGAVMSLECTTEHRYPGGDHVLFLGLVTAMRVADPVRPPLVYHRGAYARLAG